HLDDRAEAAVERAAARGLDHVHLPAEEGVAVEHARVAPGQTQRSVGERLDGPVGVVVEAALRVPPAQAADPFEARPALERAQQLVEGRLALAADDEVDGGLRPRPGLRSEARVVAAGDDARGGTE